MHCSTCVRAILYYEWLYDSCSLEESQDLELVVTTDPWNAKLLLCVTYTPRKQYSSGYDSAVCHTSNDLVCTYCSSTVLYLSLSLEQLVLDLNDLSVPQIVVYVHPAGQNLLIPNNIHGRDFLLLPNNPYEANSLLAMYDIRAKKIQRRTRNKLPCHEDENPSIRDCVEEYFESE